MSDNQGIGINLLDFSKVFILSLHAASPLITLKNIRYHLSELHMLGFLRRHEQNKGLSGGQYCEYELNLNLEIVLETCREITEHTE